VEHLQVVEAVRDIAGVAMEEQHHPARVLGGHPPRVQGLAVGGADLQRLEPHPVGLRGEHGLAPRAGKEYEVGLEQEHEHQHRPVGDPEWYQQLPEHAPHRHYQRKAAPARDEG